jgi:arsenate reductase
MSEEVVTVWHNPSCASSRAALSYLQERKVPYREYRYLEERPNEYDIRAVLDQLGLPASDILRANTPSTTEAGVTQDSPEDAIIAAMTRDPILIQRPIVITTLGAVVARPASLVDAILP